MSLIMPSEDREAVEESNRVSGLVKIFKGERDKMLKRMHAKDDTIAELEAMNE